MGKGLGPRPWLGSDHLQDPAAADGMVMAKLIFPTLFLHPDSRNIQDGKCLDTGSGQLNMQGRWPRRGEGLAVQPLLHTTRIRICTNELEYHSTNLLTA